MLSRSRGNNIDAPRACFRRASLVRRAVMHDAPPCDQARVTRHLKRLRRCSIASCPAGSESALPPVWPVNRGVEWLASSSTSPLDLHQFRFRMLIVSCSPLSSLYSDRNTFPARAGGAAFSLDSLTVLANAREAPEICPNASSENSSVRSRPPYFLTTKRVNRRSRS